LTIREKTYEIEKLTLSDRATLSENTRGRKHPVDVCDIRTDFQRDRDRIIHSKSFRRLKHKTQVFITPEGDHYRTRLTHTLEVAQIARTIARALRLNEDLTEAIALGHDLGHTPFGHAGERALDEVCSGKFRHNEQSFRLCDKVENGTGLNLTAEVLDGILHHTGEGIPYTLEGQILRFADKIAYINHDIDDAIRGGVIKLGDLPQDALKTLGLSHSDRIETLILDIINNSVDSDIIKMSSEISEAMYALRKYLFANVYNINSSAKTEEGKAENVIKILYSHFMNNKCEVSTVSCEDCAEEAERKVIDYIAGMTDRYAVYVFEKLYIPKGWNK